MYIKLMNHDYIVYIDEAGDEGFGKLKATGSSGQSKWLLLGACIVSNSNDKKLPKWRDDVLNQFPNLQKRDLHFRNLKHDRQVVACKSLAQHPLGICIIASNKITLLNHSKLDIFKQKGHLYNYLIRFLLERVCIACAKAAKKDGIETPSIKIVFSRRGGTDYQEMTEYLKLMRDDKEVLAPKRGILWGLINIDSIRVENHTEWAGLQIADVATSAFFKALEPNFYGNYEPTYAYHFANNLIANNYNILDCGLTLIPPLYKCPLDEEQNLFIQNLEKKRRAPGS